MRTFVVRWQDKLSLDQSAIKVPEFAGVPDKVYSTIAVFPGVMVTDAGDTALTVIPAAAVPLNDTSVVAKSIVTSEDAVFSKAILNLLVVVKATPLM